jgi:hypothetical protein
MAALGSGRGFAVGAHGQKLSERRIAVQEEKPLGSSAEIATGRRCQAKTLEVIVVRLEPLAS